MQCEMQWKEQNSIFLFYKNWILFLLNHDERLLHEISDLHWIYFRLIAELTKDHWKHQKNARHHQKQVESHVCFRHVFDISGEKRFVTRFMFETLSAVIIHFRDCENVPFFRLLSPARKLFTGTYINALDVFFCNLYNISSKKMVLGDKLQEEALKKKSRFHWNIYIIRY